MTVQIDSETANIPLVMFTEQVSDPAAPSAGYAAAYIVDGVLFVRNSSGIWSPLTNPMTTPADLIVGGTSGAPARLAKGGDGQVLTVDPSTHLLVWATPAAAGSVATDAIWDAAGDLAVGSGANTAVKLAKGTDGQALQVDPSDHAVKWMTPSAGSGDLVLIAHTILASPAATIDIQDIPGTYTQLLIYFRARATAASYTQPLYLRINNDSGNNYNWLSIWDNAAGGTGINGTESAQATLGYVTPSAANANYAMVGDLRIPGYADTAYYKAAFGDFMEPGNYNGSYFARGRFHALWLSTAAISRLTLLTSSDNLDTGSFMTVYGVT